MKSNLKLALAVVAALWIATASADAQGILHARGARRNASGGVTAGRTTAFRGPNGASGVRGRSVVTDGQGNATTRSGAAYHAANGATAQRHSTGAVSNDGSASRQSSATANGTRGSVQTSADYQRNPDGTAGATRTTTATAANGDTYQGNTTWTKGSGVQHTGTCKDSSGNVIACPGK